MEVHTSSGTGEFYEPQDGIVTWHLWVFEHY